MSNITCLKSRAYILIMLLYSIVIITLTINVVSSQSFSYKQIEVLDDLPLKSDMEKYLISLEKAVHFMKKNKHYVDLNVCFGVFLANVQLKNFLHRVTGISVQKEHRLQNLVKVTRSIVISFTRESKVYLGLYQDKHELYINMMNLFIGNDTSWHRVLPKYNAYLLWKTKFYPRKEIEKLYFKWPKYQKLITGNTRDSEKSDYCLALLAQNPTNHDFKLSHCQVPINCANLVLNGNNYGYMMTHRVLILLLARFGRGCTLVSANEDKEVLDRLCAKLYIEAEFIANHDFETSDLIIEIITLCSLDGNAQFLRRSWIDELLDFQTQVGCFNVTRPEGDFVPPKGTDYTKHPWKLFLEDQMILGGSCNSHTTSVAIAMIAAAIRYIAEIHY